MLFGFKSSVVNKSQEINSNPSRPNSDENEISLYIITTYSNNQVMRIKKVITEDKIS